MSCEKKPYYRKGNIGRCMQPETLCHEYNILYDKEDKEFKAGDWAKCIDAEGLSYVTSGKSYEVVSIDSTGMYIIDDDRDTTYTDPDWFIKEEPMEPYKGMRVSVDGKNGRVDFIAVTLCCVRFEGGEFRTLRMERKFYFRVLI